MGMFHATLSTAKPNNLDLFIVPDSNAERFDLRVGPDYKKTGTKEPSGLELYELLGVSLLHSAQRVQHLLKTHRPPWFLKSPPPELPSGSSVPHFIALNVQLPVGPAEIMNRKLDGETMNLVVFLVRSHCPDICVLACLNSGSQHDSQKCVDSLRVGAQGIKNTTATALSDLHAANPSMRLLDQYCQWVLAGDGVLFISSS